MTESRAYPRVVRVHGEGGPEYVTRRIADETIIVPVAGGVGAIDSIYTLNDTGAACWDAIGLAPVSLRTIAEAVAARFDVSLEQAERDARDFVETLVRAGLVRVVEEAA
jgi:hypothetical protein